MSAESIAVLVAILASIAVGAFSRVWGRIVGLVVVAAILGWGVLVYARGEGLALFGRPLEAHWFFVIAGAILVYEVMALVWALRARREARLEFERSFSEPPDPSAPPPAEPRP